MGETQDLKSFCFPSLKLVPSIMDVVEHPGEG